MLRTVLLCSLALGLILLSACDGVQSGESTPESTFVEVPYSELVLEQLDSDILTDPRILGCSLVDLPPFSWKEVNSGMVDIRTLEDYANKVGSLYQKAYNNYQENRVDFPDMYRSIPDMTYQEFLATCDVFPDLDFSQHSLLGYHASGSGCTVTFDKRVYRDDKDQSILYELTIVEEGACEKISYERNLILVPRIPPEYSLEFSLRDPIEQ
jgi:hypothetical protein